VRTFLFTVESAEIGDKYIVTYADGTCDVMSASELQENFNVPVEGVSGKFPSSEEAAEHVAEDHRKKSGDADFFDIDSPIHIARRRREPTKRSFLEDDHSLL
jgi:hypothetical protein